jgi:hypothetical protein
MIGGVQPVEGGLSCSNTDSRSYTEDVIDYKTTLRRIYFITDSDGLKERVWHGLQINRCTDRVVIPPGGSRI